MAGVKLRVILVVLSFLSFLSVSVAGYVYLRSLEDSASKEAEKDSALQAERIRNGVSSFLAENLKTARALAGLREMGEVLSHSRGPSLARANAVLDHFRDALAADVCYVMDRGGTTVASSNRDAPDSFVGNNFAFRPYWRQAIRGSPSTYMAQGVTSKARGVYFSHPVYDGPGDPPIGVAVIKISTERIEQEFRQGGEGIVLLADPKGIVFAANRREWLYRSLHSLTQEDVEEVARSQQFGPGPWEWSGLSILDDGTARDRSGAEYRFSRLDVSTYPGWSVVHLRDLRSVSRRISAPLFRVTAPIILALCFLIGLSVLFLYRRANDDIVRRRAAEEALQEAQEKLTRHSGELERQVKERTRRFTSILRHTPAVVYVKDREGRYIYVNPRFTELFGVRNAEVRGRTDFDVFPREFAGALRENDRKVFDGRKPVQAEETFPQGDDSRIYLTTRFPIYDEEGEVATLCGISTDISGIKRAEDQLRRLSDSIIAGQEKERAAVARELHDEFGQVLTALALDAAWLRDRLKGADPAASRQAQAMCGIIDKAIDEVRGIATRLRPGALDNLGLVDALDWYIRDFEKRSRIRCVYRSRGVPRIADKAATAAYRIAQEALTNVARHSGATRVDVALRVEEGVLLLSVEDDGKGFESDRLDESKGLGVVGMRERASLIGGTLSIGSSPDGGTRIGLRLPLRVAKGEPA
ncbi:MAG: PAS domain S-box protein [Deltaproteobacteria bacterium]|nr:MAG: PAS domain S-box protein [Deltaproteobacteria bacterium]